MRRNQNLVHFRSTLRIELYKVALDTTTSVDDIENLSTPENFELLQNYPNPFNPSTQITYNLKSAADVQLTVYNSLGQKVKTLVNENVAAGAHTVEWNGTNMAGENVVSGIYFYTLKANDKSNTMKMILLR